MTERARILIAQAKLLSPSEQEQVVEALLTAFGTDVPATTDATWKAEVERRLTAIDRGEEATQDFETALEELQSKQ
jgi:putative addiction module component (TIGR02574 family)